jgi:chemotaxis protein histidine kinase CheA
MGDFDEQMRVVRLSFMGGLAARIDGIDEAIHATGPLEDEPAVAVLRRRLHTLRGASATLGYDDLAERARIFEDALGEGDDVAIDDAKRAELAAKLRDLRALADALKNEP